MLTRKTWSVAGCVMAAVVAGSGAQAQVADSVALERGRELTNLFYDGDMDAVVALFDDTMREAIGGPDGLSAFRQQITDQLGAETEVSNEEIIAQGEHRVYVRTARFEKFGGPINVVWAFDTAGRVAGFQVRPAQAPQQPAPSAYLEYETRTPLRLPFEDEWTVYWGGREIADNYHAAYADQRFAYDLVVMQDGRTHTGEGRSNEDYHCFGRTLVAPGAGVVVVARDGVPDNTPGELNNGSPPGNHVVIDHGNDEYSLLAHIRHNTVRVAEGDRVAAGDPVGECGNSGRSTEPHLHYHLQNAPAFGRGEGLPAMFLDYFANDSLVARGEPVKGQRIRPAPRG